MLVKKKKKQKQKVLFPAGKQSLTGPPPPSLPPLISLPVRLVAPPCLAPSLSLPWSLSFSLTPPHSYIKSYQPLEEHIKVLRPVKSYRLSALQYHYMFHPHLPPYLPPFSLNLLKVLDFIYTQLRKQRHEFHKYIFFFLRLQLMATERFA